MEVQNSTAIWLANRLGITTNSIEPSTTSATPNATTNVLASSSYQPSAHVLAIADKLIDGSSAIAVVSLREDSLEGLATYLEAIQGKVSQLNSDLTPIEEQTLLTDIDNLEKEMSKFVAKNLISQVDGVIEKRNVPDQGFERFIQILDTETSSGAAGFIATIEVDMAEVLTHAHSPVSCPICQQGTANSEALSVSGESNSSTPILEDAATTNTTNVTGAKLTSTSPDGFVEAITHSFQWDLSEGETLSYSFYTGAVPYDPNYGAVWPTYASPLNAQQQADMREVYALWDAAAAFEFEEIIETDANNIGELRVAYMTDPTQRPNAAAFAYIPNNGTTGGDAWYVTNGVQDVDGGFAYNLDFTQGYGRLVALHEIGHSIGLSHPHDSSSRTGATYAQFGIQDDTNTTVMSYTNAPDYAFYDDGGSLAFKTIYASTPMVYDVAASEYLYGSITDTNTGDTTYSLTDRNYIQTIVDSGGVDTIDLSAMLFRSNVDLTPGSFNDVGYATEAEQNAYFASQGVTGQVFGGSRLFTGTDNLGIAFSATIENIIGSSGDDIFTGNSVNNVFKGNGGDDQIDGGGGNANYAVFNGNFAGYSITSAGSGTYLVEDIDLSDGDDGTDTLTNIQFFEFADLTYNVAAARTASTTGGALTGQSVAPKAIASAISIAPATKRGDTVFQPLAAAHSIGGINLATEEGRAEALILLEIGLANIRGQSSALASLRSQLSDQLTMNLGQAIPADRGTQRNSVEMQVVASSLTRSKQALFEAINPTSQANKSYLDQIVKTVL